MVVVCGYVPFGLDTARFLVQCLSFPLFFCFTHCGLRALHTNSTYLLDNSGAVHHPERYWAVS